MSSDGHAIVCPFVLGLLKAHLRCCEPHLSHHPTIDFLDTDFTPTNTNQLAHHVLIPHIPCLSKNINIQTHCITLINHGKRTTVCGITSANTKNTSNTPHSGAWARPRPSTSRTPQQSRSSNASPAPASSSSSTAPAAAAVKPATTPAAPAANVWAQRAAAQKPASAAAGKAAKKEQGGSAAAAAATPATQEKHVPVNNFNDGEVRQMMGQGATSSVYKVETNAKTSNRKVLLYD